MDLEARAYVKKHPIECIFFSEFHHKQGPKITFQVSCKPSVAISSTCFCV